MATVSIGRASFVEYVGIVPRRGQSVNMCSEPSLRGLSAASSGGDVPGVDVWGRTLGGVCLCRTPRGYIPARCRTQVWGIRQTWVRWVWGICSCIVHRSLSFVVRRCCSFFVRRRSSSLVCVFVGMRALRCVWLEIGIYPSPISDTYTYRVSPPAPRPGGRTPLSERPARTHEFLLHNITFVNILYFETVLADRAAGSAEGLS